MTYFEQFTLQTRFVYGDNTIRISVPDNTVWYGPKTNRKYTEYCRKCPVLIRFTARFLIVNHTVLIDLGNVYYFVHLKSWNFPMKMTKIISSLSCYFHSLQTWLNIISKLFLVFFILSNMITSWTTVYVR
jgi:hypothetical protein